jgi:hypothetical protein
MFMMTVKIFGIEIKKTLFFVKNHSEQRFAFAIVRNY